MKKLIILIIIISAICSTTFAQTRATEWATIKTLSLRCWECKKRLEDYMAKEIAQTESGIIKMQINLLSGTTRVQYYTDRTNLNYIQTAFANAGFDADDIKAEPDSYKRLPPQCKRVEEGGGPKKGKPCHMQPM
jgi:hypothetical protein